MRAKELQPFTWLADGALIVHLSFQRRWVYARVLKDGHQRTRRYRHDQDVRVETPSDPRRTAAGTHINQEHSMSANHRATAERLADVAHQWSYGDHSDQDGAGGIATAVATEGLVHAVLALVTEIRDWRSDERIDQPPLITYRAAHDGIGLGDYTNRDAARDHCLDLARAEGSTALAWVTEADDDTDELNDASEARVTGYTVSPIEVMDTYDPDAEG